ncbi:MAG: hypothetical protein ACF8NJ_05745 [Phycisphaerales bacterium JB038]
MKANRFDVLPINPGSGPPREFFVTTNWGAFDAVERRRITYSDVIEQWTSVRDLIRLLAERERNYLFLANEGQVTGLVSIAHLNCRQVRVYLYALLADLERRLADHLRLLLNEDEILRAIEGSPVAGRFRRDRKAGVEADATEYLLFSDLIELASEAGLIQDLDMSTATHLDLRKVKELRTKIAHPIKSVVGNATSVRGLWDWVSLVEEMIFGLRLLDEAGGPLALNREIRSTLRTAGSFAALARSARGSWAVAGVRAGVA